jgi:hypothetical protein
MYDLVRAGDLRLAPRQGDMLCVTVTQASAAIEAAAGRLSVRLVEHATVVARANASVGRLDAKIAAARSSGELQIFNREFRRRRMEAEARRQPFPTYNRALAKLRGALARAVAGTATADLVRAVFEERG